MMMESLVLLDSCLLLTSGCCTIHCRDLSCSRHLTRQCFHDHRKLRLLHNLNSIWLRPAGFPCPCIIEVSLPIRSLIFNPYLLHCGIENHCRSRHQPRSVGWCGSLADRCGRSRGLCDHVLGLSLRLRRRLSLVSSCQGRWYTSATRYHSRWEQHSRGHRHSRMSHKRWSLQMRWRWWHVRRVHPSRWRHWRHVRVERRPRKWMHAAHHAEGRRGSLQQWWWGPTSYPCPWGAS